MLLITPKRFATSETRAMVTCWAMRTVTRLRLRSSAERMVTAAPDEPPP